MADAVPKNGSFMANFTHSRHLLPLLKERFLYHKNPILATQFLSFPLPAFMEVNRQLISTIFKMTIPKMLRIFFKYTRRLRGKLCCSAVRALFKYFEAETGAELMPAVVAVIHRSDRKSICILIPTSWCPRGAKPLKEGSMLFSSPLARSKGPRDFQHFPAVSSAGEAFSPTRCDLRWPFPSFLSGFILLSDGRMEK